MAGKNDAFREVVAQAAERRAERVKLAAAFSEALEDCRTHRDNWLNALKKARSDSTATDEDERWWDHEIAAFERTMDALCGPSKA